MFCQRNDKMPETSAQGQTTSRAFPFRKLRFPCIFPGKRTRKSQSLHSGKAKSGDAVRAEFPLWKTPSAPEVSARSAICEDWDYYHAKPDRRWCSPALADAGQGKRATNARIRFCSTMATLCRTNPLADYCAELPRPRPRIGVRQIVGGSQISLWRLIEHAHGKLQVHPIRSQGVSTRILTFA